MPRWLPNAISILRILLVPIFVWRATMLEDAPNWEERAGLLAILIGIGVSDILDGWLARKFDLGTNLGALLDAVADKLAQVVLLTFFTLFASAGFSKPPLWFFVIIVGRDGILGLGWLILHLRHRFVEVVHEAHGKASSTLMFGLLVWITAGGGDAVVTIACAAIGLLVVLSTTGYVRAGLRQL